MATEFELNGQMTAEQCVLLILHSKLPAHNLKYVIPNDKLSLYEWNVMSFLTLVRYAWRDEIFDWKSGIGLLDVMWNLTGSQVRITGDVIFDWKSGTRYTLCYFWLEVRYTWYDTWPGSQVRVMRFFTRVQEWMKQAPYDFIDIKISRLDCTRGRPTLSLAWQKRQSLYCTDSMKQSHISTDMMKKWRMHLMCDVISDCCQVREVKQTGTGSI